MTVLVSKGQLIVKNVCFLIKNNENSATNFSNWPKSAQQIGQKFLPLSE